jgi:hypothetical protein
VTRTRSYIDTQGYSRSYNPRVLLAKA